MKTQKLFVIVAIICLLVGASGASMAQSPTTDCPGGVIVGGEHEGIRLTGLTDDESCVILGSAVIGSVIVTGTGKITIMNSYVEGDIRVIDMFSATIVDNDVGRSGGGHIVVRDVTESDVLRNLVGGNIRVIGTSEQDQIDPITNVLYNETLGNLRVNGNFAADVRFNLALQGNITCNNNVNLMASTNVARGGRVACFTGLGLE